MSNKRRNLSQILFPKKKSSPFRRETSPYIDSSDFLEPSPHTPPKFFCNLFLWTIFGTDGGQGLIFIHPRPPFIQQIDRETKQRAKNLKGIFYCQKPLQIWWRGERGNAWGEFELTRLKFGELDAALTWRRWWKVALS